MISSYNYWYVALSILVAYVSAFATLGVAKGLIDCPANEVISRILGGAILLGTGIWGMHFIAMTAFHLPIPIGFDFVLTLASGMFSILGAGIAFWILCYWRDISNVQWVSGILMGCSVAAMHFIGMAAMRITPAIEYNGWIVTLSVLVAILSSVLAFKAMQSQMTVKEGAWAAIFRSRHTMAVVLATGISSMHYIAMTAASFHPNALCKVGPGIFEQHWMPTLTVIVSTLAILVVHYVIPGRLMPRTRQKLEDAAPIVMAFIISAVIFTFWQQGENSAREKFELHANHTQEAGLQLIQEQMRAQESLLKSLVAFYKSSQKVEPEELHQYITSLQPNPAIPAIQSIGTMQTSLSDNCTEIQQATLDPVWPLDGAQPLKTPPAQSGKPTLVPQNELINQLHQFSGATPPFYIYLPKEDGAVQDADYLMLWPLTKPTTEKQCQTPSQWIWLSMSVHDALLANRTAFAKAGLSMTILEHATHDHLSSIGSPNINGATHRKIRWHNSAHTIDWDIDFSLQESKQEIYDVWQRLTLLISTGGGILLVIIIWLLSASRKEAARETKIAQANLAENIKLTQHLEDQNVQMKETLRVKEDFLGAMSHELRTPLNSMLGFAQILASKTAHLQMSEKKYIERILSGGQVLLALITDVLTFSKAGAGKLRLSQEPVQPYTLISQAVDAFEWQTHQQRISMKFEIEAPVRDLYVQIDILKFQRILNNLVSNAIKFSQEGSEIIIKGSRVEANRVGHCGDSRPGLFFDFTQADRNAFLEVSVSDYGIGIDEGDLGRLFKPFSQIDSALSRQHDGSGLGLALVKSLVELHGGAVSLHSLPGSGTTVYVWLPWREDHGDPDMNEGRHHG